MKCLASWNLWGKWLIIDITFKWVRNFYKALISPVFLPHFCSKASKYTSTELLLLERLLYHSLWRVITICLYAFENIADNCCIWNALQIVELKQGTRYLSSSELCFSNEETVVSRSTMVNEGALQPKRCDTRNINPKKFAYCRWQVCSWRDRKSGWFKALRCEAGRIFQIIEKQTLLQNATLHTVKCFRLLLATIW